MGFSNVSNITLLSNVYPRKDCIISNDVDFIKRVQGRSALSTINKDYCYGTMSAAHLSEAQETELANSTPCTEFCNKLREQTWGPVLWNGEERWVCRCENTDCAHYENCMSTPLAKRIERTNVIIESTEEVKSDELKYSALHLDFSSNDEIDNNIFAPEESSAIESEHGKLHEELQPQVIETSTLISDDYTLIDDAEVIIKSPINQNILVNAGPGTGKTYSAIRRLEYIITNELVEDYSNILVLCYTRSAVKVIRDRIRNGVEQGILPYNSMQVEIATLDSFASQYLYAIEDDIEELNYDDRIVRFIDKFDPSDFSSFEYLIIDEIQDLVNIRAKMALTIIKNINCGYLLLGDKCQAIYDYDANNSKKFVMNSTEFYNNLESLLDNDSEKYELTKNMRQSEPLLTFSANLRYSLLHSEAIRTNHFIQSEIKNIKVANDYAETFIPDENNCPTAILCRNNGEAAIISSNLYKHGIEHTLQKGNKIRPSFNRWIADILWDYCSDVILRTEFVERYLARINDNIDEANEHFDFLLNFTYANASDNSIEIRKDDLLKAMRNYDEIPNELLSGKQENLVVSTIHKAKGQEFDRVYLLDGMFDADVDNTEEARVWYVAVTRPKENLILLKKKSNWRWYTRNTDTSRPIKTNKKVNCIYCTNVEIGYSEDIDSNGFVSYSLDKALDVQETIAFKVKENDEVELILDNGTYGIFHLASSKYIGKLSQKASDEILNAVKINPVSKLPERLSNLYVSKIVSIPMKIFDDRVPLFFRESKIWYGIEISGFAKIDWHYGE